MKIKIQYHDETIIELDCVESIRFIGYDMFLVKTFGNSPVRHAAVRNLDIITWGVD